MFERFKKMTEEELENIRFGDLMSTELEIVIYETVLSQNDRAIANRFYLHGDDYSRIAEIVSYIPEESMKTTTTSEKAVKNHKKDILFPCLQDTFMKIVEVWDREYEKNWIETQRLLLEYFKIKKELHYI